MFIIQALFLKLFYNTVLKVTMCHYAPAINPSDEKKTGESKISGLKNRMWSKKTEAGAWATAQQPCPSHRHTTQVLLKPYLSPRPSHLCLFGVYHYCAIIGNTQKTTKTSHISSMSSCISQCRRALWI